MTGERSRRERMVAELVERGIRDRRVLEAMRIVPRERFVEEWLRERAYDDGALPIGEKQTISQPWIVARMTELLEPDGKGRVLEVGTGSGYQAAILGRLFESVYSVERSAELSRRALRTLRELGVENVHLKIFDGSYGWSEFAPYRAILVGAAAPRLPTPLWEQLEEGGRLVLPIADPARPAEQTLVRFVRRGPEPRREDHGICAFVPLVGKYGWPG
jgi:protein-L-isoaspartate(D-aspartate) O-methyltransferase